MMFSERSGIDCRPWDISKMSSHMELALREGAAERRTKRIHVCLAGVNIYPVYAGPAIRFRRYLPGFKAHGIEVEILTGTPDVARARATRLPKNWGDYRLASFLPMVRADGVPIRRVRLPDMGDLRRGFLFGRALARHCTNPATRPPLVQLLSCGAYMLPALIKLRSLGIPTVYTRTLLPDARARPWVKREAWKRFVRGPMQLVDVVVVSSLVMEKSLRALGVTTDIRVIPNGVDTTRFCPPRTTASRVRARDKLHIPQNAKVALFLGPIVKRKGIDLLLEAWKTLAAQWPDLHLILAGPRLDFARTTETRFGELVMALVEASGAEDRVHFTGMVEDPEAYMQAADLFVFPSRREGMPNVVPEAMATGLPVIMTPFQGLPSEFGQAGQHYLLAEFTADNLAEHIGRLLADGGLRRTMGAAAREWAQTQLDVASSIQRYANLYGELATRTNRRELDR